MARTPVQFAMYIKGARGRFAASSPRIATKAKELMRADVKNSFEKSVSPDGDAWPALKYRAGKPLIKSGRLYAAALRAIDNSTVMGNRVQARMLSSRVRYGRWHQRGTKRIPKRKFFGYRQSSVKKLAKFIAKQGSKALTGK